MLRKGFTLIELLLIISLLALITMFSFASFGSYNGRQALSASVNEVKSTLAEARSLTLASVNDEQYGVHVSTDALTLFSGNVYKSSGSNNVVTDLDSHIEVSSTSLFGGGSDVIFDRLTGDTSQSGTITLTLKSNPSSTQIVTIDATGIVH